MTSMSLFFTVALVCLVPPPSNQGEVEITNDTYLTDGYIDAETSWRSETNPCVEITYRLLRLGVIVDSIDGGESCSGPPSHRGLTPATQRDEGIRRSSTAAAA